MNYSIGAGSAQANIITQLPGNKIHTVKWAGAEAKDIESKASGETFKIISLKFKNEDGVYEDTIFESKPGDDKRVKNQWGYDSPSAVEEMMFKIKHLMAAVNPKVATQIEKNGLQVGSWDELRKFVVDNTKVQIGTETQIKLLSRTDSKGVTKAHFPGFVLSINKANEVYPKTNFIGAKLAFTAKEQEKINNATTAKPSNIDLIAPNVPALSESVLDALNLDAV